MKESELRPRLISLVGGEDIFNKYDKLTSHEERISFVYNLTTVKAILRDQSTKAKEFDKTLKNNRESARLRELGNCAFKSARDHKALDLYTEALMSAQPTDGAFALALANRSAACLRLGGRFWCARATADIDRALRAGHPAPLKLKERKITCLMELGRVQEARNVAKELLKMEDLPDDKKEEIQGKLVKLQNQPDFDELLEDDNFGNFSANDQLPALSSAIKIQKAPERGRFGVANRDIKAGEILVHEVPAAAKIKKELSKDHCENCLKFCGGFQIPCPRCIDARFCSEKCLDEAESSYHQIECSAITKNITTFFEDFLTKTNGKDGTVGFYRLLLKLVAKKPLEFFTQQSKNGETYEGLFSLVRHSSQDTTCSLFWMVLGAVFHLRALQMAGYFGKPKLQATEEAGLSPVETKIGAIFVDIFQLLRFNTHAIFSMDVGDSGSDWTKWKTHTIGTAIYPSVALLNHSCDPNIFKYFTGSTLIAVANRNIYKGEEVTENYFPLYTHAEKIARQSWLLDHYNFHCRCIACIGNYKLRSELQKEKDPPWRCLVCHELILADNFYCCKKSKGEAEMKNLLDEVMTEIEQIKANVNQLDGQASSISELKQQKLIFLKSFQRLCDLVGPNCEQFLGSHEFFKALLNKLFGNNGITPDR